MSSATATSASVLAKRRDAVLLLTLNRPDRLNAWNDELEERYFALLDEAAADPQVRAVVVTGAGRGFCAGADMDDLRRVEEPGAVVVAPRPRPRPYPLRFPKPLVAAINGPAAGLGLVEALYCDVRFCTPEAKLTTAFVRRGLIAEYGAAWLLTRLVGPGVASDLLLSGRVVRGEEALRMRLVERLAPAETIVEEAVAYAHELATWSSPRAMATIKRQLRHDLDCPFEEALAEAETLLHASLAWPDVREGVASHLERRPPAFPPFDPNES